MNLRINFDKTVTLCVFVPLSIALIIVAIYTLRWPMAIDSPLMMYLAFLMDKFDYLPYRDFIDPNMLGTYSIYLLAGHFTNYTDVGFRIANIAYLSAISLVTWLIFKKISAKVGWAAFVVFGLIYLDEGPILSFQREFLILLPLTLAIYITEFSTRFHYRLRFLLAGVMLGFAFLIKPHALIFLPTLLFLRTLFKYDEESYRFLDISIFSCIGFLVPVSVNFLYLWVNGILPDFLDIVHNYWPLYSEINGEHVTMFGNERYIYVFQRFFRFGGLVIKDFIAPLVGIFISLRYSVLSKEQKKLVYIIAGFAIVSMFYPIFAFKMWFYHYLIFYFFLIMLGSLCLVNLSIGTEIKNKICSVILLITFIGFTVPPFWEVFSYNSIPDWKIADGIAGYLKGHANKGDYVQPLDWCDGVLHGMLKAQVPLATPIIYNVDLYHHISSDYTKKLRRNFINDLKTKKPRFIIQNGPYQLWITGKDTTTKFPELEELINLNYHPVVKDPNFTIYEYNKTM